jgi:hypothetical protein
VNFVCTSLCILFLSCKLENPQNFKETCAITEIRVKRKNEGMLSLQTVAIKIKSQNHKERDIKSMATLRCLNAPYSTSFCNPKSCPKLCTLSLYILYILHFVFQALYCGLHLSLCLEIV